MKAKPFAKSVFLLILAGIFQVLSYSYGQPCKGKTTITDSRNGKVYPVVEIGTQCWLQKNVDYITGNSACPMNEIQTECDTSWGQLYDWETALIACPRGWHIPSLDEFKILVNFLGGADIAGGKMKQTGTSHWSPPNAGATNESGFRALAAGYYREPILGGIGDYAYFWTSTEINLERAYLVSLKKDSGSVGYNDWGIYTKEFYFSVRCIKN